LIRGQIPDAQPVDAIFRGTRNAYRDPPRTWRDRILITLTEPSQSTPLVPSVALRSPGIFRYRSNASRPHGRPGHHHHKIIRPTFMNWPARRSASG
jgi:hypothetical protein